MRNLILSAFPRNMRLPDPFTPNLKVDLLPDIAQSPKILSDVTAQLCRPKLMEPLNAYLNKRSPPTLLVQIHDSLIFSNPADYQRAGTRYNVPLINSLVLYVGCQGIAKLQSKSGQDNACMDVFEGLVASLKPEGRYHVLNAVANQLRFPNNHTHYFSCVLLYIFLQSKQPIIMEQITRVLLERLIVHRPHPWGLLITFIELIKNPRYGFWKQSFVRCAPEIERLFESVARSCMYTTKPTAASASGGSAASATGDTSTSSTATDSAPPAIATKPS
jgi:CCR4-NOT transcription complex subunit 1